MSAVPSIGRPRTKAETAAVFKVSPRTIQRWVNDGELRCTRPGGVLRFTDEHINEFLEVSEPPAPAPEPVTYRRNPKYARTA